MTLIPSAMHLELAAELNTIVATTVSLDEALGRALAKLGETTGAAVGEAWVELTPGALTSVARWSPAGVGRPDPTKVLVGEGVAGCVYANGRPALVSDDTSRRALTKERMRSGVASLRSSVGVPVLANGRVIAVITFGWVDCPRSVGAEAETLVHLLAPFGPFVALRLATGTHAHSAQTPDADRLAAMGLAASTFVHDFSNMLTAILGYSYALGADEAEPGSDLASLHAAATRGLELTRSTLRSLRAQPTAEETVAASTDVGSALARLEPLVSLFAGERIAVDVAIDGKLDEVAVDVTQFEQAILNLAINARDAMPEGGSLRIVAEPIGVDDATVAGGVRITVSDNGTGMDEETLAAAFTPFFTTKRHGTGLGLHAVKRMVEKARGTLRVSSSPGEGTSLVLELDRAA
ncbi:MAG: ATP-binding protein [Gaiellales bacterium]